MSLRFRNVVNGATPEEEYARFVADADVNLKGYALVDRTFDPKGNISNEFRHIFVFPDLNIKKGDWVRLYTGKGKYEKFKLKDKPNHRHDLFWGAKACVYNNNGGDVASLIRYTHIDSKVVPAVEE